MDFTPDFVELIGQRREDLRSELNRIIPPGARLVLEVGCGHGHFLTRYATEHAGRTCLGVDLRSDRILRAQRKACRARLSNCHFVRTEAFECLYALPSGAIVDEVWVLFPDPWPKKRHHKNRLLQPAFLDTLATFTPAGTRLYFRTDHQEYFEAVSAVLPTSVTWQPDPDALWPFEEETVFQARAESYRSLVAVRTSHPAKPTGKVAPGLPPQAAPMSPA